MAFVMDVDGRVTEAKTSVAKSARGLGVIEGQVLDRFGYFYVGQQATYGGIEFTHAVSLPANALVDVFDITVTAARATLVQANQVAQVRSGPSASVLVGNQGQTVVVDFATPRTVSTVSVPVPYGIVSVATWNGAQFMPPLYRAIVASRASPPYDLIVTPSGGSASATRVVLPAEPRTERLQIEVAGPSAAGALIEGLTLVLPDAPGDLEIRIDGAAPAWTHPGPVHPGAATAITDGAWSSESKRGVHLAAALGAQTGDPVADGERSFELRLTSRAPGLLRIEDGARRIRRIRRARFDGRTETRLAFDAEGERILALSVPGMPAGAGVLEARLVAEARFGHTRTLPPVGPAAFPTVDLVLDPDRAVLVRLPAGSGLAEWAAVRLPLAAGSEGAEVRVVLWGDAGAGPDAPLPDASSSPVTLQATATPDWVTFEFPQPVAVVDGEPPWAAVLVTRGQVTLGLARSAGSADPLHTQSLRLGPHGGPWTLPPAALRSGAFASVRGRSRVSGTAPREAPLAPFTLALLDAEVFATGLDPGPNGQRVTLAGGAGAQPALRITAYGPGTVTLRDIDIITES